MNSIITSDGGGNITATGVLVELTTGGRMRFNASKEVIISAGALHVSLLLLENSGRQATERYVNHEVPCYLTT